MLRLGIDKTNEYASQFGLGQLTGVDLPNEVPGVIASKQYKLDNFGEQWFLGDSCNVAIGQGYTKVTPLQMAAWAQVIANGGMYFKPHLGLKIIDNNGKDVKVFTPELVRKVSISEENLNYIREAMHIVVNDPWGSAFPLRGVKSDPAVKTGSAETIRGVGHSWLLGFFPYKNPKYSFAVYLEYGGWGYKSAEVMRDFLEWYDSR